MAYILGIETSCDESSASVVNLDSVNAKTHILSLKTFSQVELHIPYGGVVPEVSSRSHLETLPFVVEQALQEARISVADLTHIAVTTQPGLIGSLMVGVSFAKSLAYALRIPLIPVHHLMGHIASLWINRSESDLPLPMLVLLVSGGHTMLLHVTTPPSQWSQNELGQMLLGQSKDDAAGEAFDKIGKLLGFNYPAGAMMDQYGSAGDRLAYTFPKPMKNDHTYEFSFSGLKTAAKQRLDQIRKTQELDDKLLKDFSASFQEAIIDALYAPLMRAIVDINPKSLGIVGGVSANSRLRARLNELSIPCVMPELKYCSDNAAMIATLGAYHALSKQPHALGKEEALKLHAKAHL